MIPSGFDVKGKFAKINKDPSASLPYSFDWTDWLEGGDTIVSSTWTPPAGISVSNTSHTGQVTQATVSGGTDGSSYVIENHVVTANGLEDSRRLEVNVVNR